METVVFVLGYRARPFLEKGYFGSIKTAADQLNSSRVVFLDNYSRDGTVQYLIDHHFDVDILLSPRNYLYCKAINYGLQYIYHRYNPDYYILVDADNPCKPDAYCQLVAYAKKYESAGMVQPVVRKLQDESRLYSCGHYIDEDYNCRTKKRIPDNVSELEDLISCSISSTLIKKDVFLKCGLLDTRFEMYWESMDLAYRARRKGFKCACCLNASTYNEGGRLSEIDCFHERYYRVRNKIIFYWKNDKPTFDIVMRSLSKTLEDLNNKNNESEYGLSVVEEATRQGIQDGIAQIHREGDFQPSITDFEKGNIIFIQ